MKRVGVLMCALLVLGGIGCGGGDGDGGDATVTRAEFVEQAEAICSKATKERQAAVAKALKANEANGEGANEFSTSQVEAVIREAVLPPLTRMTQELGELDPPDAGADRVEAMVAAYESAVAEVQADPAPLAEGKARPFEKPTEIAGELKIPACAVY